MQSDKNMNSEMVIGVAAGQAAVLQQHRACHPFRAHLLNLGHRYLSTWIISVMQTHSRARPSNWFILAQTGSLMFGHLADQQVHLLKGAPFKLAMLHKVVPEAGAIVKGQRVLASVQLKVEAL